MKHDALVPSFLEVPFSSIVQRIDSGSRSLLQLTSLLTEKKELQEKDMLYTLRVGRTNVFAHEIEASTSERLLGFYKNYHLFLYKATIQQHKDYSDQVLSSLESMKSRRGSRVIQLKQTIQNDLKNIGLAKEAVEKSKKVLSKAEADYLRATEKLAVLDRAVIEFQRMSEEKIKESMNRDSGNKFSMGRMFSAFESNPEPDRDKQVRKVEKRRHEVLLAKEHIVEKKRELLHAYHQLDEDHVNVCR
jgi:hypothetical protein